MQKQLVSGVAAAMALASLEGRTTMLSLDEMRSMKLPKRATQGWPGQNASGDRARRVQGDVLRLPGRTTNGGRRTGVQLDPYGRPYDLASEGAANLIPPQQASKGYACSERTRFVGQTISVAKGGGLGQFSVDTPGAFCPKLMYLSASNITDFSILQIQSALDILIISGVIPAAYYSTLNPCCPNACFPCLCAPGVELDILVENNDTGEGTDDITVGLIGDWYDMCDKSLAEADVKNNPCGDIRLIGFESPIDDGEVVDFDLSTPGKYCVEQAVFFATVGFAGVLLDQVAVALDNMVIGSGFPLEVWSDSNEGSCSCPPFCIKCTCAPGQTIDVSISQSDNGGGAQVVSGVFSGPYADAC